MRGNSFQPMGIPTCGNPMGNRHSICGNPMGIPTEILWEWDGNGN